MTEWGVVLVVVTLCGLGAAIVRPVVSLTNSITTLTVAVKNLEENMSGMTTKNSASHDHLWAHEKTQDAQLCDHEKRIIRIEGK